MNILGINNYFEHPSVALICNGELVFCAEEERYNRIKHGKSYNPYRAFLPYNSIYQALKQHDLTFKDIDEVAFSYNRWAHFKSMWTCLTGRRLSSLKEEFAAYMTIRHIWPNFIKGYEMPHNFRDRIILEEVKKTPYREWDHHLCHAASAFFCSGFDESLVIVADGSGENACTSIYTGHDNKLKKIASINLPHSLGFFYSFITQHLGFEPFSDEYKVMGLAAYGNNKYVEEMSSIVTLRNNGLYTVNLEKLLNLEAILGQSRNYKAPIDQIHKDIACSAQICLEQTLEHIAKFFLEKTGMKKLCLAGGVFLNILANSRLVSLANVEDYFIQPASHDAGTAIGAAALSWINKNGNPQIKYNSMFLGNEHNDAKIEQALKLSNLQYTRLEENKIINHVSDLLADEKIVAFYRGKMEFGPRALGNRSIIASPKSEKTRIKLNELKVREQFRPLAPLVTSEDFSTFFEGMPNRYMMLTTKARENAKELIPAVVHHDGTSRTQVIYKEHDSFLHSLLLEFKKRTGIPILINTSLNVRGLPIVESPFDAISAFISSGIDYILMGNYLIEHPNQN